MIWFAASESCVPAKWRSVTAWIFYDSMRMVFLKSLPQYVGAFWSMSPRCVESLDPMRELRRFLLGMVAWGGYPQMEATKYTLRKTTRLALTAAVSLSGLPMQLSVIGAPGMTPLALEWAIRALVEYSSGYTIV